MRQAVIDLAIEEAELSPRDLAVQFTDTQKRFLSEASVYRISKAQDLITSPVFIVVKKTDEFWTWHGWRCSQIVLLAQSLGQVMSSIRLRA